MTIYQKTVFKVIAFVSLSVLAGQASAKVEDCLGENTNNGAPGQAVCVEPRPIEWVYGVCDDVAAYAYRMAAWCIVSGGTWIGNNTGCVGGHTPMSEGNLVSRSEAFSLLVRPGSCMASASPSGWGQTISTYHCWSGLPVSKNGILIRDYQSIPVSGKSIDSEGRCELSWTEHIYAIRTRSLQCPAGARSRTKSNGDLECWYLPVDRCEETVGSSAPPIPGSPSPNTKSCSSNLVGNPINVGSLNKVQREEDLAMMSGGLSFVRHFNSAPVLPVHPETMRTTWDYWRHTYMRSIIEPYNNNGSILGVARRENGYLDYYDINGNPITKNGSSKLQKNIDGWILTRGNGDKEYYDPEGKLIRISPLAGNEQTLSYSDETTPVEIAPDAGLLIEVADSYGRTLLFTYNEDGFLVSMIDPANNEFFYDYDDAGRLSQVTYPDQTTRTYLYENTAFPYFLTGIVDHNGTRLSTYTYNSKGEAVTTERSGGVEAYSVSGTSPTNLARSTTILNPQGGKIVKQYTNQGGVLRPVQVNWYQCVGTSCTSTGFDQYTYDASGNVGRYRDKNGNYAQYTYDLTRNLETKRVEGLTSSQAVSLATRTISTDWHPTLRLPVRVAEPNLVTTTTYDNAGRVFDQNPAGNHRCRWHPRIQRQPHRRGADMDEYLQYPGPAHFNARPFRRGHRLHLLSRQRSLHRLPRPDTCRHAGIGCRSHPGRGAYHDK